RDCPDGDLARPRRRCRAAARGHRTAGGASAALRGVRRAAGGRDADACGFERHRRAARRMIRPPHILFITATRIGDAVLSTGLLSYLIDRFPNSRLTIAAGPVATPLFEAVPQLERLEVIEKKRWSAHWLPLYTAVVRRRWDLVV